MTEEKPKESLEGIVLCKSDWARPLEFDPGLLCEATSLQFVTEHLFDRLILRPDGTFVLIVAEDRDQKCRIFDLDELDDPDKSTWPRTTVTVNGELAYRIQAWFGAVTMEREQRGYKERAATVLREAKLDKESIENERLALYTKHGVDPEGVKEKREFAIRCAELDDASIASRQNQLLFYNDLDEAAVDARRAAELKAAGLI